MEKYLFIGNSHTYYNEVPHMVAELYRMCLGKEVDAVMLTTGGMSLKWHSEQIQDKYNIKYGKYDAIVLQDKAHPFESKESIIEDIDAICELVGQTDSKACLYMTWAHRDEPDTQKAVAEAYSEQRDKYGCMLAPTGLVWEKVRFSHPEINLFAPDGGHASINGSYLSACTIFCTLANLKELSPDLDDAFYAERGLEKATCEVIHEAVKEILKDFKTKG